MYGTDVWRGVAIAMEAWGEGVVMIVECRRVGGACREEEGQGETRIWCERGEGARG